MKKRIISILIASIMIILLIPAFQISTFAESTYVVTTAEKLRSLLQQDGDFTIVIDADIVYKLPFDFKWDGYDQTNQKYIWATLGNGTKTLNLQGHTINIDDDFVQYAKYQKETQFDVSTGTTETKTVLLKDRFIESAALLRILKGATLNIYGYGAEISMTAQIPSRDQMYDTRIAMQRDIFDVDGGNLNIYGGTYQAGRSKSIYVSLAEKRKIFVVTEPYKNSMGAIYDAAFGNERQVSLYADYMINGTAVLLTDGNVMISGGTFKGFGYEYIKYDEDSIFDNDLISDANGVIEKFGGTLLIQDGIFIARDGSVPVKFKYDTTYDPKTGYPKEFTYIKDNTTILAGEFRTEMSDYISWPAAFIKAYSQSSNLTAIAKNVPSAFVDIEYSNDTETSLNSDKTIFKVKPKESIKNHYITWDGGSKEKINISINGKNDVKFEHFTTYFKKWSLESGQLYQYYWSLMVQKSDGKWAKVTSGWLLKTQMITVQNLTNNWNEGYTYRIQARFVETWTSESHTYTQTVGALNTLEFTVSSDKTISSVSVDGFSGSLTQVGPTTLTSKTQGVKDVSSIWYENGNPHSNTIDVKSGTYQAYVTLKAKDGYIFTKDTTVQIYGLSNTPSFISSDGKTIQVTSPVINKVCNHEELQSGYDFDSANHYRYCAICGKTAIAEKHTYDSGISNGNKTIYTCTTCGYEKTVQNNRESINALLLSMPALVVNQKLTTPVLSPDLTSKATIVSYQWYEGKGTQTKVNVGATLKSGWYTLEIKAKANSGYYFTNNAFITHSHGTKAGATATDNELVGYVNVYCSDLANATVNIPSLSPDKTIGDVLQNTVVTRSGDSKINLMFSVIVKGGYNETYLVEKSYDGKWKVSSSEARTLDNIFATKITPNVLYEIEISISNSNYYIDPDGIQFTSGSYLGGVSYETTDAWTIAHAYIISDTDLLDYFEVTDVTMPVLGQAPDGSCVMNDSKMILVDSKWNTKTNFECGRTYVFTAEIHPKEGYKFKTTSKGFVNGLEGVVTIIDNVCYLTYDVDPIEHSFENEVIIKEATCTQEGLVRLTCSGCGQTEDEPIPATGHIIKYFESSPSTCHTQGYIQHNECVVCGTCFDMNEKEIDKKSVLLPLDSNNHEGGEIDCDENEHYTLCVCGVKLNTGTHTFGDFVTIKEPSTGVEGLKEKTCSYCGYIVAKSIPALSGEHTHSYKQYEDENYHWSICSECGNTTEKESHNFDSNGICIVCSYNKNTNQVETDNPNNQKDSNKGSLVWLWIVLAVVLVGVVVIIILVVTKKKKKPQKDVKTLENER